MNREWISLIQELSSKGLTPEQVKQIVNINLEIIEDLLVVDKNKN